MPALLPPRSSRRRLVAVAATALLVLLAACSDDSDGNVVADATEDTGLPTQPAPTTLATAAGAECVEATDVPEAEGKPTVEMPVGEVPTELQVTDITEGDGAEAELGSTITVDYVGIACSTGMQFDASYDSGQPAEFALEEGGLIMGWTEGIPGMKVGGQRMLVIPPDLAYGAEGNQGIAPGEALVFVIDLKAVGEAPAGDATTTVPAPDGETTTTGG